MTTARGARMDQALKDAKNRGSKTRVILSHRAGRQGKVIQRLGARVALVSQALVDREWPGGDPLGERITFNGPDAAPEEWMEVVGVVGSVRHRELASDPDVEIYVPMEQGLRLWDVRTGTELDRLRVGPISRIDFPDNGRERVTGSVMIP